MKLHAASRQAAQEGSPRLVGKRADAVVAALLLGQRIQQPRPIPGLEAEQVGFGEDSSAAYLSRLLFSMVNYKY